MIGRFASYSKVYFAFKQRKTSLHYAPIQVAVEPTNICNLACRFCNQNNPEHFSERRAGRMIIKDYEIILDKIKKSCLDLRVLSLTLDGEPTLHKDLPEMIRKANEKGFFVRFSTNGTKIDREFLEKTRNMSYLMSVDFSIDKNGFEKYRGGNGSWSLVNENLKEAINYLDVNKNLYLEVYENSAYYNGLYKARYNLKLVKKHFGRLPRLFYGLRRYHRIIADQSNNSGNNDYYGCYYPWTSLNITWSGDVVTCCRDLEGKCKLGNILQSSIEEIWNGRKYLYLRDSILENKLQFIPSCRSCDLPYDSQRKRWDYAIKKILQRW